MNENFVSILHRAQSAHVNCIWGADRIYGYDTLKSYLAFEVQLSLLVRKPQENRLNKSD
jgi:hypothetical protein